jgi:LCP family protein required for cell wall assembly
MKGTRDRRGGEEMAQRRQAAYTRYTVAPHGAPRSPLWLRVLKLLVLSLVIGIAFTGGVAMSWLQRTAAQVAHNDPAEVKSASKQLDPALPSRPVDILVIGSDRRVSQPDVGARSDTLIVVRFDPQNKTISMLSVPRDLLVTIPGYGQNKINAAYSFGGAKLAVQTVRQVLGVPINHFVDIDFDGFKDVVNKLGGAYLMVDTRYYNNTATDDWASIDIEPGYQRLDGAQTLDFVRFRHDQNGDFTRIVRQQMFLREMKRELAASANLADFPRLLSVATTMSHYAVSDLDSLGKLYSLVSLVTQVDTTHIYQTEIAGSTPTIDGVDYVSATPQQISTAVGQFLHPVGAPSQSQPKPTVAQLPRAEVRVTVLNGSGQNGIAGSVAAQLKRAGYAAAVGGNAANFSFATTTIACDPASLTVARRLAVLLAPAHVEQLGSSAPSGRLTVTVGSLFSGQLASPQSSTTSASQLALARTTYDRGQWQTLERQSGLTLFAPTVWTASLGYDQFRAYRVTVGSHHVRAAVVVGTTPQGGFWDIQALKWTDPPILADPDAVKTVAGRSYSLYYDDANLHLVAWRQGGTVYWVSNTLGDELSNPLMLALATSCSAVKL